MSTTQSGKIVEEKAENWFPDDIIVSILSRLPVKSAIRFQLVCRKWRDLILTHDFKELHMGHSIPMILVEHFTKWGTVDHFLLDKWWEPEQKRLVFHRIFVEFESRELSYLDIYQAKFSHGGLIVFQQDYKANALILNPISHEKVKIKLCLELWSSMVCGVFFHPLLREYCTLWRLYGGVNHGPDPDQRYYYKILNLGSKPCWREISNPWSNRVMVDYPVLIGEYLYWLVNPEQEHDCPGGADVMAFDIRSEKLDLMHCPVPLDVDCGCSNIKLLDIDGVLSFVLTSRNENLVNVSIWKLKDGAHRVWVPMNCSIKVENYPRSLRLPATIAVVGEQLVLLSDGILYVCNLKLGSTRTIMKKEYFGIIFPHVMRLASLKNCRSEICMDEEGEVDEVQSP